MYRDTFGYLWVGTGEGLSLFNGYEFKNFKSRINDSLAISNNRIRAIRPSMDGKNIWVGTEDGLNCFSRENVRLTKKIALPECSGLITVPLYFTDTTSWFLMSSKGIFKLKAGSTKPQEVSKTVYQYRINALLSNEDFLYQTLDKQLQCFSVRGETIRTYDLPEGLRGKDIHNAVEAVGGTILLASENGLWRLEKNTGKIERYPFDDDRWNDAGKKINAVCVDSKGRIWMGITNDGLFVYDPQTKRVRPVCWEQSGLSVQKRLEHIMCIQADPYGIVWVGTDGNGLVKIITDRIFFGEEYFSPLVTDTCHWFIKSFYKDNSNRLWVGTYGEGIKLVDYKHETIQTLPLDFLKDEKIEAVTAICPAPDNALLIGTNDGLYLLDTISWKSRRVVWTVSPAVGPIVNCICRRRDGSILVGTNNYLFCVKGKGNEMHLEPFFSRGIIVSAVGENENGDVAVGSYYLGIFLLDKNGVAKDSLIYADKNSLPAATLINGFAQGEDGFLFASSSIGLIEFTPDLKIKTIFTDADGLPDNMLYGIAELPDHSFFISTGKGVSIFDRKSFENYSEKDGMKSDECNTCALHFSDDQNIYIGGVNGFDFRHYPFVSTMYVQPRIYFEKQFSANALKDGNEKNVPAFELNYLDNTFSFQLWQSDFTFSERTTYHYQLKGFDPKEVTAAERRFVRYAGVNPGQYNFVASFSFPGFGINGTPLFSVTVIPPYWQSTWFRILAVLAILLLIASIIYFILQSKYKKRMQKLEMLRQLERIRIRISGDIHDDIGAGLTRIALTSDLVSRQLEANSQLQSRMSNMANAARDLSQSLKEVVWSVKPEYDRLDSMVNYFKGYCGEFFEHAELTFSFQTLGEIPSIPVSPEIRRNLLLILKEASNNAMKHANASKIETHVHFSKGIFSMEICDNGCGIPKEQSCEKMNSSGLKNMQQRVDAIGFQLEIKSNLPSGTKICVWGPISENTTLG